MYAVLRKNLNLIQLLRKLIFFFIDISGYMNHMIFVESFFEFKTLQVSMKLMRFRIPFVFSLLSINILSNNFIWTLSISLMPFYFHSIAPTKMFRSCQKILRIFKSPNAKLLMNLKAFKRKIFLWNRPYQRRLMSTIRLQYLFISMDTQCDYNQHFIYTYVCRMF